MLHSFIKAGKLRRWLARVDCPPVIKECKLLFDKAYSPIRHDIEVDNGRDSVFVETSFADEHPVPRSVPDDLHPLVQKSKIRMRARIRHHGVVYATSSVHLGNSLVHFYPHGDKSKSAIPGSIKYIYEHKGQMLFAVQRQHAANPSVVDPFKPYLHFPAKLYSSSIHDTLEVVCVDWVLCHFAQWQISSDHVVILSLSRVCYSVTSKFQVLLIK
jgi:hypothetical protein